MSELPFHRWTRGGLATVERTTPGRERAEVDGRVYSTRSGRLELTCPHCSSTSIRDTAVLEHKPCGCVEFADTFAAGSLYFCPKCRSAIDERAESLVPVGRSFVCRSCDRLVDEPELRTIETAATAARTD